MLVIVEGVNGVGKSTFIECLRRRMLELAPPEDKRDVEVLHRGPPIAPTMLEEYELPLQDYRPSSWQNVICDRWHLGEEVYGPMLRGMSLTTPAELRHIDLFLEAKGALIVHLVAPTEAVLKRRAGRTKRELITDDQVPEIVDRFLEVIWNCTVNTVEVVWEETPDSEWNRKQVDLVVAQAVEHSYDASKLEQFVTYVGSPRTDWLLVGEKRNQNSDTRWDAAFVPLPSSSGEYLFRHLPESLVTGAGIVNAVEERHHLRELLGLLKYPRVVTLGRVADDVLTQLSYPHGSVPHPQYVRRFHHHSGREYGQVIRRALTLQEDHLSWRPS